MFRDKNSLFAITIKISFVRSVEYVSRRQRIEIANVVVQLLSYAHPAHKRPYAQIGADRLIEIGALTDNFPPHDCSLNYDVRSAKAEAEELVSVGPTRVTTGTSERSEKKSDEIELTNSNGKHFTPVDPTTVNGSQKTDESDEVDHLRCKYLRHYLNEHWASMKNVLKRQPINHVREYFGESIAWYFAWIGILYLSLTL